MKKILILLSLMAGMALALVACSGTGTNTPAAGANLPGQTPGAGSSVSNTITSTVGTVAPTQATSAMTSTQPTTAMTATQSSSAISPTMPALTATTQSISPTVVATQAMTNTTPVTGSQGIPATGSIDPGLVSNLLQFGVFAQGGGRVGDTADLVIDAKSGQVTYLVVKVNGKLIPVPWKLVTIVPAGSQSGSSANGPQNDFQVSVAQSTLTGAPSFAVGALPNTQQANWDASIQAYWQGYLTGSTGSGGMGGSGGSSAPTPTPTP